MRGTTVGTIFLGLGVVVGAIGTLAVGTGAVVDLPPRVQTLIALKLIFIGSGALLVLGASIRRRALRSGRQERLGRAVARELPDGRA